MQLRLVYSLLKPAIRAAARFRLPIKSLTEMLRLAYFEHLSRSGMSMTEIAEQFGQSTRHMRSLAQRLDSSFFEAERDVGLGREIEARVAAEFVDQDELAEQLPSWSRDEIREATEQLIREERLERDAQGRVRASQRYVVLRSDGFQHRIDSLNHFLDGIYRAAMQRLVRDDHQTAMMKTISFSARKDDLTEFLGRLEGDLRRDLAEVDEKACFEGHADERYTLTFGMAPVQQEPHEDSHD